MALSRLKQETVILFNEAEAQANIYTYNSTLKRRLGLLSLKFPSEVTLMHQDDTGAVTYATSRGLISIRQPVSDERRQAARERALKSNLFPPRRE